MSEFFFIGKARGYLFQGVFFTSDPLAQAVPIEDLEFSSEEKRSTEYWEQLMAAEVKALGGNAVIEFWSGSFTRFGSPPHRWSARGTGAFIQNLSKKEPRKPCVACAELILSSAKLCRYCQTLQGDPRFH